VRAYVSNARTNLPPVFRRVDTESSNGSNTSHTSTTSSNTTVPDDSIFSQAPQQGDLETFQKGESISTLASSRDKSPELEVNVEGAPVIANDVLGIQIEPLQPEVEEANLKFHTDFDANGLESSHQSDDVSLALSPIVESEEGGSSSPKIACTSTQDEITQIPAPQEIHEERYVKFHCLALR
jgi:hypothetical protein